MLDETTELIKSEGTEGTGLLYSNETKQPDLLNPNETKESNLLNPNKMQIQIGFKSECRRSDQVIIDLFFFLKQSIYL